MPTFQDAIAKLKGRFVEVGTQGEWSDRGELQTVAEDHLILAQQNSERITVVRLAALEYIKELPPPSGTRGIR